MRIFTPIIAACALGASSWSAAAIGQPAVEAAAAEERLPHISVRTVGEGEPIVLIPGLSSPRAVWENITPELARNHRVILVQVNGFAGGDPGANLQPGILDGIVEDLHTYIAANRLGSVRLIGHSMGGLTALMFAKAHPDQVREVMVVDALPFFAVLMDPAATVEGVKPMAAMMRDRIASSYGKPADPAAIEAQVKSLALEPQSVAQIKQWAAAADPRVTAQALYEDLTTDIRPQLADIIVPVTLVVPWSDTAFGEAQTLAFYKRQYSTLPNAAYVGIGGAGHFVMLDQPEAFAAAVAEFAD